MPVISTSSRSDSHLETPKRIHRLRRGMVRLAGESGTTPLGTPFIPRTPWLSQFHPHFSGLLMSPEDLFLLGQNCKHRRMQRLLVASLMMELCLKRLEGLQHSPKLKTQKRLLELSATQRSGLFQLQLGVWKDVCWWHWWVQGWYPWWHAGVGPGAWGATAHQLLWHWLVLWYMPGIQILRQVWTTVLVFLAAYKLFSIPTFGEVYHPIHESTKALRYAQQNIFKMTEADAF